MSRKLFMSVLMCALLVPCFAQKRSKVLQKYKSQTELASAIVNEIQRKAGKNAFAALKSKVKTKGQFVSFLKDVTIKCENCEIVAAFSDNLRVTSNTGSSGLHYGNYLVQTAQNEDGTDPEPDTDGDEDDDRDTDSDADREPDCGPFHCLSRWGEHFPCTGVPGM